jgi:hypothetical protein
MEELFCQNSLDSVPNDFKKLPFSAYRTSRNVRHGHMSTNTTVTFRNFIIFAIRFLILLEDQISEILSGFDNNWSYNWIDI